MKLQELVRSHKNSLASVISVLMFIFLTYQYFTGVMTFAEYSGNLGLVGGAVATFVAAVAPDGKTADLRAQDRESIILQVKQELTEKSKNEIDKPTPDTHCNCDPTDCKCVLKEGNNLGDK